MNNYVGVNRVASRLFILGVSLVEISAFRAIMSLLGEKLMVVNGCVIGLSGIYIYIIYKYKDLFQLVHLTVISIKLDGVIC